MKKQIFVGAGVAAAALAMSASSQAGKGTLDAASITITVYKFGVSANADCSSPVVVFTSDAGVENDLLSNPTYGSGRVAPGTYPCIFIEVSKIITTSASTSSGSCVADQVFSDVICRDGQGSQLADGTPVTCSGGAANPQHVTIFITTASAGMGGDRALLPPLSATDTTSGIALTGPLVVSADTPVTLTVDPRQFLDGSSPTCSTSAPSFSAN